MNEKVLSINGTRFSQRAWYILCLFFTLLNGIEKPDKICSPTFVVDEFSGLFLHPSIFSIKHSISA